MQRFRSVAAIFVSGWGLFMAIAFVISVVLDVMIPVEYAAVAGGFTLGWLSLVVLMLLPAALMRLAGVAPFHKALAFLWCTGVFMAWTMLHSAASSGPGSSPPKASLAFIGALVLTYRLLSRRDEHAPNLPPLPAQQSRPMPAPRQEMPPRPIRVSDLFPPDEPAPTTSASARPAVSGSPGAMPPPLPPEAPAPPLSHHDGLPRFVPGTSWQPTPHAGLAAVETQHPMARAGRHALLAAGWLVLCLLKLFWTEIGDGRDMSMPGLLILMAAWGGIVWIWTALGHAETTTRGRLLKGIGVATLLITGPLAGLLFESSIRYQQKLATERQPGASAAHIPPPPEYDPPGSQPWPGPAPVPAPTPATPPAAPREIQISPERMTYLRGPARQAPSPGVMLPASCPHTEAEVLAIIEMSKAGSLTLAQQDMVKLYTDWHAARGLPPFPDQLAEKRKRTEELWHDFEHSAVAVTGNTSQSSAKREASELQARLLAQANNLPLEEARFASVKLAADYLARHFQENSLNDLEFIMRARPQVLKERDDDLLATFAETEAVKAAVRGDKLGDAMQTYTSKHDAWIAAQLKGPGAMNRASLAGRVADDSVDIFINAYKRAMTKL